MTPHYFDDPTAANGDSLLLLCIRQGYVPKTCLLAGAIVLAETQAGRDPCAGCAGPRSICGGRPQSSAPTGDPTP